MFAMLNSVKRCFDSYSFQTARFLPAMIVIIVVDIALVIYWCMFIYTQTVGSSAGASSTRKQSWPIAPFVLRLL